MDANNASNPAIWTPDAPAHIQGITASEMKVLEDLHAIAQRLNLVLLCGRCGGYFQGQNDGHSETQSISCSCREIRARRPPTFAAS